MRVHRTQDFMWSRELIVFAIGEKTMGLGRPELTFWLPKKGRKHGAWALVLCPGPAAWGLVLG